MQADVKANHLHQMEKTVLSCEAAGQSGCKVRYCHKNQSRPRESKLEPLENRAAITAPHTLLGPDFLNSQKRAIQALDHG
jgi:hypothetical protein